MKKTIIVFLIVFLTIGFSYAQSLSQVVVASSGATITGASNTLSFTVGEVIIGSITNGEYLDQGFWPGVAAGILLSNEDFTFENQFTVYPNPVVDFLNFNFKGMSGQNFEIQVYDTNGRQVLDLQLLNSSESETLNLNALRTGIYFLSIVESASNKSKSFKIIKQ